MTTCPKHIIIVGGGVIGVEFATFFYRLGVPVTIVEMLDRLLGPLDKDVTSFVEAELKSCGVELVLGVKVESIEDGLKVHYASVKDGAKGTVEGDVVLMAGGRAPQYPGHWPGHHRRENGPEGLCGGGRPLPHQCTRRVRYRRHQRQDAAGPCSLRPGPAGGGPHRRKTLQATAL